MTPKQITVIAYFITQPGTEQMFFDRLGEIITKTRAEPGCISYHFHQHNSEPYRFMFYENFIDQAAFDDHVAQPYIKEWIAFTEANGARFEVNSWTMISRPD